MLPMKKKVALIGLLLVIIIGCSSISLASYFMGETIGISSSGIELIANDVHIDTTSSKVTNEYLIKNNNTTTVTVEAKIPLMNTLIDTQANHVKILINGVSTKYTVKQEGEKQVFYFPVTIEAGEYKKIVIGYDTNDLTKAKILSYDISNLGIGTTIKRVTIRVSIREVDIPLITKIEPQCYEFSDHTIAFSYYNMELNELTQKVIIEKQALGEELTNTGMYDRENEDDVTNYNDPNLPYKLYGPSKSEYNKLVEDTFKEKLSVWLEKGITLPISKEQKEQHVSDLLRNFLVNNNLNPMYVYKTPSDSEPQAGYHSVGETYTKVIHYLILKQFVKENKYEQIDQFYNDSLNGEQDYLGNGITDYFRNCPLLLDYIAKHCNFSNIAMKQKIIVMDIPENPLPVEMGELVYGYDEQLQQETVEYRTISLPDLYKRREEQAHIEKIIKIDANSTLTVKQRAQYANSIGADAYIRLGINEVSSEEEDNILQWYLNMPLIRLNCWNLVDKDRKKVVEPNINGDYGQNLSTIKQVLEENNTKIQENKQKIQTTQKQVDEEINAMEQKIGQDGNVEDMLDKAPTVTDTKINSNDILFYAAMVIVTIGIIICVIAILLQKRRKKDER